MTAPVKPRRNSPARQVAKNTLILVTLRVLAPALSIALMVVLSRKLGAEGVGRYTLGYSFLHVLGGLAALGLQAVVTRDGAADRHELGRVLGHALSLACITGLLLTLLMAGMVSVLDYDATTQHALWILSLAVIPVGLGALLDGAIVAVERTEFMALSVAVEQVLKIGGGVLFLVSGFGLPAVLAAAVLARWIGTGVSAALLRWEGVPVRLQLEGSTLRRLVGLAPTFVMISVFATLYWRIDVFMLSKLAPIDDVGYYGAAWRLLFVAMVLPQGLGLALYPHVSVAAQSDPQRLNRLSQTATRYLFAISLPLAVGVALLGRDVLQLIYGEAFAAAGPTLTLLIWTLVPYALVRYHAFVLVSANLQRVDLRLNWVMSAVNVMLNWILIPQYETRGAALATLASIVVFALLQYAALRRYLPEYRMGAWASPAVVIGAAVCGLTVVLVRDIQPWLGACAGVLTYGLSLWLFGFVTRAELERVGLPFLARWVPQRR